MKKIRHLAKISSFIFHIISQNLMINLWTWLFWHVFRSIFSLDFSAFLVTLLQDWTCHCQGARKNYLDFYVLSLFEISTLSTKSYNLSLDSLNKGKLLEPKKVEKYLLHRWLWKSEYARFGFVFIQKCFTCCSLSTHFHGLSIYKISTWEFSQPYKNGNFGGQ